MSNQKEMELGLHRFLEQFGSSNMTRLDNNKRMKVCFDRLAECSDLEYLKDLKGITNHTLQSKKGDLYMVFQKDAKRDKRWYVEVEMDGRTSTFMKL